MGGVGSGSWYRFNKKTTVEECHSLDVRYLHRNDVLKPRHLFSLSWSRAGRKTGSIRGLVKGNGPPEQLVLLYRCRSGPGDEWEDVMEPIQLTWTPCNFGGERP
jgi:hypothetical protein